MPGPTLRTALLALILLLVPLAGCIDSLGGGDEEPTTRLDGPYKVFLAARGAENDAITADVAFVRVVTATETTTLPVLGETLDVSGISASGQALLVAAGSVGGAIKRHEVGFTDVRKGGALLSASATWTVAHGFNVTGAVETTLTLDLSASVANGTFRPVPDSIVAENANGRITAASAADLDPSKVPPRKEITPLPDPVVKVEGPGGTFPSWRTDTPLNFTVTLPGAESLMDEAFWFFPDGNTKPGAKVTHTFRTPGVHNVTVVVQGTEGQQASTTVSVEAWFTTTGTGEGLIGLAGQEVEEGRTHHIKTVAVPGPSITGLTLSLTFNSPVQGANVFVYLMDPSGAQIGSDESAANPKSVVVDGPLAAGTYSIKVVAQTGTSIGYSYTVEARYL